MARTTRAIPQRTLSAEDRATFERMAESIRSLVGVHINQQPGRFMLDTRIMLDLVRFPVMRPTGGRVTWGGYFTYSPTYASLTPEQRWNYIAWLAGDESGAIQLFRIMRLYALCAELTTTRRDEAISAMRQLYDSSTNDAVAQSSIGNVLTLAYAASQPELLGEWLTIYTPSNAIPADVLIRCFALASIEASGPLLFDIASRCNFKLGRGLGGKRAAIEQAMRDIAERWGERHQTTVIRTMVEQTPTMPVALNYSDTLVMWVARALELSQGVFLFDRSDAASFIRGLAAAAQEQVRSNKKGSTPLDGLELLDGILKGDGGVVQFDLSGSAEYVMTEEEEAILEQKLTRIQKVPGVKIVKNEWDVFSYWSGRQNTSPDAVLIRTLSIKQPSSPEPWNAPTPPTYAVASYKTLTPEQRWWYLDWLAGEDVKPLDVFWAVRFKGLEASFARLSPQKAQEQTDSWFDERDPRLLKHNIVGMLETIFDQTTDESLMRAGLDLLMPLYSDFGDVERATAAFNRTPMNPDQATRLLELLWNTGGVVDGRGLLYVARVGGFNHTPLTRECFDQIAERAEQLINEWEMDNGPLSDLPIVNFSYTRSKRRVVSAVSVAADVARQAQEEIKAQRRSAPRTARMSAEEIEAEQAELAELPTNAGDGPAEAIYVQLASDPQLVELYLSYGANALDQGRPTEAVAFLRRAAELDPRSHASLLLPLARLRLSEAAHDPKPNQ